MKGLIFSEPMVRAWMEGRKLVTRRLMNPQPTFDREFHGIEPCHYSRTGWAKTRCQNNGMRGCSCIPFPCPSLPGETVYIKETWAQIWNQDGCLHDDEPDFKCPCEGCHVEYKADTGAKYPADWPDDSTGDPCCPKWKSPRFMPEWAARSHALIVSVRPERIKSIDNPHDEVLKEGWPFPGIDTGVPYKDFSILWESLHPGSWERKDWVWRIELEKIP